MKTAFALAALAVVSSGALAGGDARKELVGTWRGDSAVFEVSDRGIVRAPNSPDGSVIDPAAPANFAFSYVRDGGAVVNCEYEVAFVSRDTSVWRSTNPGSGEDCPVEGVYRRGEG